MSDSYLPDFHDPAQQGRESLSLFSLLVAPFIVCAVSVAGILGFNYLVIALGAVLSLAFLISLIRGHLQLSPEIFLFALFVLWASFGFLVAANTSIWMLRFRTMIQLFVMVVIISSCCRNLKTAKLLLFSFLIGCAIIAVAAIKSGDYKRAFVSGEDRTTALALNQNTFGMIMVYSTAVVLYYFASFKKLILKAGCILVLLVLGLLVISTGSREGFASYLLMFFLWFFFTYRKEIVRHPGTVLMAGLAVLGIVTFFIYKASDTLLAERFQRLEGGLSGSDLLRYRLYKEAISLTIKNPILGVGLDNFAVVTGFELYAHSNYVEVSSTTGIPGFLIYYAMMAILWFRLRKLGKWNANPRQLALVNMAKAFLLVRLAGDFTRVTYYSKPNWIFLAILIGWSYCLQRKMQLEEAESVPYSGHNQQEADGDNEYMDSYALYS